MLKKIVGILITCLFLTTPIWIEGGITAAPVDIIYVSPTGNDLNTGTEWNNSVKTLNTAITLVNNDGTIIIGEGTYNEQIVIEKKISIYSDQGPEKTILTNQITNGPNNTLLIDGILFTNYTSDYGSALYNYGTLTLNNCIFDNCTSTIGGAITNSEGTITCTNTNFKNCKTTTGSNSGGAIQNSGQFTIHKCTFTNNNAQNGGVISNMATIQATSSTFTNNNANTGGVIYNFNPQCSSTSNTVNTLFKYCDFINNTATQANIAYTDDCNHSLITFNSCYFQPHNPDLNFIGLINNINQVTFENNIFHQPEIIPDTPFQQFNLLNKTSIPLANTNTTNNTNTTTLYLNESPKNPISENNVLPIASLALSTISLLTTLTLFIKPYFFKTSPQQVNNTTTSQLLDNSLITYNMLEKVEFETENINKNKELNDLVEKIKHTPNCCPCCTTVVYMLSLLQGGSHISHTVTKIEYWGKLLEFILGPFATLYAFLKDIHNSLKNRFKE